MAAQTAGDVRQNDVAVVEFDGERRARKDLLDAAEYLERRQRSIRALFGPRPTVSATMPGQS